MLIGKFGAKRFEVSASKVVTFDNLGISNGLRTSSGDAAGKKPTTTITGAGLTKLSLTLKLNAALGTKVQEEINAWMEMQDTAKPYPFVLCGKAVGVNKFLLTSCKASNVVIGRSKSQPVMLMADLALEFSEYLPPGVQSKSTGASASSGSTIEVSNAYNAPTSAEKADMKRPNVGMGDQRWS